MSLQWSVVVIGTVQHKSAWLKIKNISSFYIKNSFSRVSVNLKTI